MSEERLLFPECFIEGCPPSDAKAEEILVYRLCKDSIIKKSDFASYYDEKPEQYQGDILAYGVSVLSDINSAIKMLGLPVPRKKGLKVIAKGITYKYTGVIKRTPTKNFKSHITWWLCKDATPHEYFEEVKIVV